MRVPFRVPPLATDEELRSRLSESRWMPGVWSGQHYVLVGEYGWSGPAGLAYYALCGQPCLRYPHGYNWERLPKCVRCLPLIEQYAKQQCDGIDRSETRAS